MTSSPIVTRLQRLVLARLPGPFLAALGSIMFLLVLQFLMKHMPDLAGRGLALPVILEIITYNLCYMVVLAVPMSVLVATLAAFGGLSESGYYRIAKGSGISLFQFAWPVWTVSLLLVGAMMYFNNEVLPDANYRAKALWFDIRQTRPGFALESGVFYNGIPGVSIRAMGVDHETNTLSEVTVFDDEENVVLTAVSAKLETHDRGLRVDLIMDDGEMHRYRPGEEERYERMDFKRYLVPLDLSEVAFERSDLTATRRSDRTTPTSQMMALVDSLDALLDRRLGEIEAQLRYPGLSGTGLVPEEPQVAIVMRDDVYDRAIRALRTHRNLLSDVAATVKYTSRRANRFKVEIHKKFSIAVACLVFLLIGVPLGLRIKRGGLGIVAAFSAGIFVVYWVSLVQGEKLADRGFLDPWIGMWAANLIFGTAAVVLILTVHFDLKNRRLFKRKNGSR